MRILLSAFACAPNVGSEAGVGWRWALELSKHHDVYVLTDVTRQPLIAPESATLQNSRLHFIYYRPRWLRYVPLNSRTAQILFTLWQFSLVPFVRRLHAQYQFDYAHHLTYGVFRHPSFLWKLGIPFVFGPVGGGERAPFRLRRSMTAKGKFKELARDLINIASRLDPFLRTCLAHADVIFARTRETRSMLPRAVQSKVRLQQEIGGYPARRAPGGIHARTGRPFRVVFAGRLLEIKGMHLGVRAFGLLTHQFPDSQLTIVGSGPGDILLRDLAKQLGVIDRVSFFGHITQQQLFKMYPEFDCLLFPSLHDSGGNVVLEALSFGLPIVCLNLGGPPTFVNSNCGIVVDIAERSESQVVDALARALTSLASSPELTAQLARGALARADEITWEKQIWSTMSLIEEIVNAAKAT